MEILVKHLTKSKNFAMIKFTEISDPATIPIGRTETLIKISINKNKQVLR
jgi:hypothetical protein